MSGLARQWAANLVTAGLFVTSAAILVAVLDTPMVGSKAPAQEGSRAAVAIRDDVIPFQKWGTRVYTLPWLLDAYDEVHYFTEASHGGRRSDFVAGLTRALQRHEQVDVFLLAHSNWYIDWVEAIDPSLRARLRLVYNTGCSDSGQGPRWVEAGADAYVGHPGASASPLFYFYFLRRWARGMPLASAQAEANTLMRKMLVRSSPILWWLDLDIEAVWRDSEARHFGEPTIHIAQP